MRMLKALSAVITGPLSGAAAERNWPQRTVKFILPFGLGSGADIAARLLAEKLSARWGRPITVENRPGVDGFVAAIMFTERHDDHELFFGPAAALTAHPYRYNKLPYDERELSPVARVSATVITICVPTSLGVNSLPELVAMAQAQPGKLNWATMTGATDLIFAAFLKSAGLDMAGIAYHDPVEAVHDVADGRLHAYQAALAIVRQPAQEGRIKLLAITASERALILPDVQTVAEAGFPILTFDGLVGIYGCSDMSAGWRERIAGDVKIALTDPSIVARLSDTGQVVLPGSPAEFATAIDKQRASLAVIAKMLGMKPGTGQAASANSELL